MKKYIFVWIAVLLSIAVLAGCGKSAAEGAQTTEEPADAAPDGASPLGGWSVPESEALTDELLAVFDNAAKGLLGVDFEPLACLGSQVVAGTNHAVFCSARAVAPEAKPYYAVVYIYEDLQGGTELLGVQSMTPGGEFDENAGTAQTLAGGWAVPESQEEGIAAFNDAVEGLLGVGYTPVRVLGQQVVSGMNYCVLCRAQVVRPDAKPYWCLAYVYRDLNGSASVTEFTDLELAAP